MASALKSKPRTLLSRKPQILSSFFTERWFNMLASFSTHSISTNKPEVMNTPSNIPDEKHKPFQDYQYQFPPKTSRDLFLSWGCTTHETSQIFERMPSLHNTKLYKLQSKLKILHELGFHSSDLVKIISCRPRFLRSKINNSFYERIQYLETLFGSKKTLQKAILRNPSVLTYDLKTMIKPTIDLYKSMGLTHQDLTLMLLSRPTIIPRTSLTEEKLDYINRTKTSKTSKMYKYVVTIFAISRVETIREKVANLEKFGFTEDEVFRLLGSSPLVLTLSVDKVQRNMTFVVASMKLPARVVLSRPFLLFMNLETVLKPRMIVIWRIEDLGLGPRNEVARCFTALRMTEKRFLKVFIECYNGEIRNELMECYTDAIGVKRLAEESKKIMHKGFPF